MNNLPTLLLLLWTATAVAENSVSIYQLTGAIQCIEDTSVPLKQAADLLRGQGVKVISAARHKLPQHETGSCGTPTGEANVMEVAAADWSAFLAKNPDAGGYGLWEFDDSTVRVYMYDGTLQCGMGREISLEETVKKLEEAGVHVVTSYKGTDGLNHISVCGASTGAINIYVIDRGSLPAAQRLGYRLSATQAQAQRTEPEETEPQQSDMTASSPPPDPEPVLLLW